MLESKMQYNNNNAKVRILCEGNEFLFYRNLSRIDSQDQKKRVAHIQLRKHNPCARNLIGQESQLTELTD